MDIRKYLFTSLMSSLPVPQVHQHWSPKSVPPSRKHLRAGLHALYLISHNAAVFFNVVLIPIVYIVYISPNYCGLSQDPYFMPVSPVIRMVLVIHIDELNKLDPFFTMVLAPKMAVSFPACSYAWPLSTVRFIDLPSMN